MLGWNTDVVNLYVIPYAKQSLSCRVDTIKWNTKLFCTFVYAANGGNERRELWKDLKDMNEFRYCINNIEMEDVASSGLFYTWTKNLFKVKAGNTSDALKKLDKIMAKKGAFKFSNFVGDKEEFLPLIYNDKALDLKQLREEENIVLQEYVASMKDEEKILYQKAKFEWLSVGDRHNAYFHKVFKSRNHKCRINTIHDDYRNKYEGDDVAEQFNKLSEVKANEMVKDVSDAEIKEDMFLINGNKAHGPDSFSYLFFKRAWNIVGEDVYKVVKEYFVTGKLLTEINSTLIILVAKYPNLSLIQNVVIDEFKQDEMNIPKHAFILWMAVKERILINAYSFNASILLNSGTELNRNKFKVYLSGMK
ncbi:hypothetical protein Tco_0937721 [Tanacetum coccineum]|uniref:RNA-directed DNA polymerase, eukaryota, reverse transcriptase zinc-binding domain protein n=1 Tax=Tanacetum coccineum TaxID=301880 RepID=A0ABQ5DF25_9ASTR